MTTSTLSNALAPLDLVAIVVKQMLTIVTLSHAKTEEFVMMPSLDTDVNVHPATQVKNKETDHFNSFYIFLLQDCHVKLT